MTKTEARAYALRMLAAEARHHASNGSEWLEEPRGPVAGAKLDADGRFTEADHGRVVDAVERIATELETGSRRLQCSRLNRMVRRKLRP